jgi:hypothetical protein
MSKFLLLAVGLIFVVSPVAAQDPAAGVIELYSDPSATSCVAYDVAPGLLTVYVYHMQTAGATASQFMVVQTGGALLTYLGESSPYIAIGYSQTGVSIAYGYCVPSPNLLLTINYFSSGLSAPCSLIEVVPDPGAIPNEILVADCGIPTNVLIGAGRGLRINPDFVHCTDDCSDIPIAVEQATWGQVKGLYR